jgi:hypothetical protein
MVSSSALARRARRRNHGGEAERILMSLRDEDLGSSAIGGSAPPPWTAPAVVTFQRRELNSILNLYGRMVAAGEWRDYAIDFLKDQAVFSIYRRTSDVPLYRVVKTPSLARRQGAYSGVAPDGRILRRGQDLDRVLMVMERKLAVV